MRARMLVGGTVGVAAMGLCLSAAVAGDVKIGVNIGIPAPVPVVVAPAPPVVVAPGPAVVVAPPPIVFAAPPALVVVPGSSVYHVPSANFNVFVFSGRYYSLHGGTWFMAPNHSGPWRMVAAERVPQSVRAVPPAYYKIPPGHAKKMGGAGVPPGHAKGHRGGKRGGDD